MGAGVRLSLQRDAGAGGEDFQIGSLHETVCICQWEDFI